ncbi:glycosyltransferase family 4 protein [Cupriavidus basilensis]|uniref:Glycosyltransferase n=1 Tax=Cupriavidus basilensis TaxID=68895 RepID=A0A0C4YUC2_9BURK|nr:glycosyltransferase family 4 protein [Cupriavidus basilensis]AJG24181.1 Glycosyltransferase [Cupriavidus basilensis]
MKNFRVLIVHNAYRQWGGEDSVVDAEIALLRSRGHAVATYFRHNDEIAGSSKVVGAVNTLWSNRTRRDMAALIEEFRPTVIHVHNTFPLVSPAVYWAASKAHVPVVQTLHNFRLMCLNAFYLHDGQVCEECTGHLPWRGVVRKCYRGSTAASIALASTLVLHRGLGTYRMKVARYIALNEFCRTKFIEGGLPASRIAVKPNFVDFHAPVELGPREGLLFVGRLSAEKGVKVLAEAAEAVPHVRVRVVGDGPDLAVFNGIENLDLQGILPGSAVREEMCAAIALVVPSIWYENFPRTIVEAFACGLPVIASRIGALADLVCDGRTGLLFEAGNSDDLAKKMEWALTNRERMAEMGRAARAQYEREFSSDVNYDKLINIYEEVTGELCKN